MKKYIDKDGNTIDNDNISNYSDYSEMIIYDDYLEKRKYEHNQLISIDYNVEKESSIRKFNLSNAKMITFNYDKKINAGYEIQKFKKYIDLHLFSTGEEIKSIDGSELYVKTTFLTSPLTSNVDKFFFKEKKLKYAFEYNRDGEFSSVFDFSTGEYIKDINSMKDIDIKLYENSRSFI